MGDVFDALARSKGKPAPLDMLTDRPVQVEAGAGLPFDEAELADRDKPLVAPLNPLPVDPPDVEAGDARFEEDANPSADTGATARAAVISQQYRQIRDGLRQRGEARGVKVHLFASSTAGEARTQTLINIGIAFSELPDRRVLLLEAELRSPSFHRFFQKPFTPGLAHLLRGELVSLDEVIHSSGHANVDVLPAGDCVFGDPGPRSLLSGQNMADLMLDLRSRYDHILIDAPPLDGCDEACVLGSMADEALLIVRLRRTPGEMVERSKRLLRSADIPVAGTILSHG